MLQNHSTKAATLSPTELVFLQRVFDLACQKRGVELQSPAAATLAVTLIDLYRVGIHDERQLMSMVSNTKSFP
jgi:hypothetical protein